MGDGGECRKRIVGFSTSLSDGRVLQSVIESEQSGETRFRVEFYRAIGHQVRQEQKPVPDLVFGQIVARDLAIVRHLHEAVGAANTENESELQRLIAYSCTRMGLEFMPRVA